MDMRKLILALSIKCIFFHIFHTENPSIFKANIFYNPGMSLNMSITVGKLKTCKYVHNRMLILHLNNIDLGIKLGFFRLM